MTPGTRDAVAIAVRDLGSRIPQLLRSARDPATPCVGTWTVGDVAAHLVSLVETYPQILAGEGSPRESYKEVARDNQAGIDDVATTDLSELAERFAAGSTRSADALDEAPDEVAWHGGLRLPAETVASVLGVEYTIHGYDIADAAGLSWQIPNPQVCALVHGLAPLLPYFVDREAAAGLDARIRVRLRGDDRPPVTLHFRDGELEVTSGDEGRVDCTISADPASWVLVSYGRQGPLWPTLTGRIAAWGRKPWLAVKLQSLIQSP